MKKLHSLTFDLESINTVYFQDTSLEDKLVDVATAYSNQESKKMDKMKRLLTPSTAFCVIFAGKTNKYCYILPKNAWSKIDLPNYN